MILSSNFREAVPPFSTVGLISAEALLIMTSVLIAWLAPRSLGHLASRVESQLRSVARRPWRAVMLAAGLTLVCRLALLPWMPVPVPGIPDEFSYLLAADTFASGRLANPTPVGWEHFESFHTILQPSYASMYPPGQGLMLALGQWTTGLPWIGVLTSCGLMVAAITWMLQGWTTPGWALAGGLLTAIRIAIPSYWMNSYWGGAVAATGGALVLGALGRMRGGVSAGGGAVLALGAVILMNSRPWEGFVLTSGAALVLLVPVLWRRPATTGRLAGGLLPVLAVGAGLTGYYCWRVTGDPATLPYQAAQSMYATTRPFLWQKPRPTPSYRHPVMMQYYVGQELTYYTRSRSVRQWLPEAGRKLLSLGFFYFWPGILVTLVLVPALVGRRETRRLLLVCGIFVAGLLVEIWPMWPHYTAPAAGLFTLLLVLALSEARKMRFATMPAGLWLSRLVPVSCCVALIATAAMYATGHRVESWRLLPMAGSPPGNEARAQLQSALERCGGKHLLLVRYAPDHPPGQEWVYNGAELRSAPLVWAREMDAASNSALLAAYPDRTVWLVEPDSNPLRLTTITDHSTRSMVCDTQGSSVPTTATAF